jgi:RES domain-containing protein
VRDLGHLARDIDVLAFWQGSSRTFEPDALVTSEKGNRWNVPGQPTAYLAGDAGLALVERGRHLSGTDEPVELVVWRLRVILDGVLDLRPAEVQRALGLEDPCWVLDRERCRGLGALLRSTDWCRALLAPSAGVPDDDDRWNLVVFVDRLGKPLTESLHDVRVWGTVSLGEAFEDG